jgi:uncharacterized RDD family membrane protein YckC
MEQHNRKYAGFWARVWASLIDSLLLIIIIVPLLFLVYGKDYLSLPATQIGFWYYLFVWILPAVAIILFWFFRGATPGKIVVGAEIIDFESGKKLQYWQLLIRYLGYFVSTIVIFLGFIWIAVDDYKRGWHDILAGSAVVYTIRDNAKTKLYMIISAIAALVFFIASYFVLTSMLKIQLTQQHDLTTGQYIAEGFDYGRNVSTSECWSQTLRRINNCDNFRCELNQIYFLKACMGASYATTQKYQ